MKPIKIAALSFLCLSTVLLIQSCKKIKEAAQISIPLSTEQVEFTIPIIVATGTQTIADVNFPLNVDSIIKANDAEFATKNIKSVSINSCQLNLLDGDATDNFSALQDCSIKFSSNVNSTQVTLSEVTNNPDVEAQSLILPVNSSLDLAGYFKTNSFSYRVSATARKTTSKPLQCKATVRFTMKVGL
jgi:hypothetical protein